MVAASLPVAPFPVLEDEEDDAAVLQWLCANDVDVEPGRLVYTAMLNERGQLEPATNFIDDIVTLKGFNHGV